MADKIITSHVLKLTGSAELPEPLEIDQNYHIALDGSIITSTDSSNDDGTLTRSYKIKVIKIELLKPTGETIKLKDTRSNSQLMRSLLYKKWVNAASDIEFEDFYTRAMSFMMGDMDRILDKAGL